MENPHKFDEHRCQEAGNEFSEAVTKLWEAGASETEIDYLYNESMKEVQSSEGSSS